MKRDDDSAFCAWVEARRGDLVRTATLLAAGDQWAAEDLVQTTLTRMYVRWSRIRAETVDAYARRCLLNALLDHRRRPATRLEQPTMTVPQTAVVDPELVDRQSAVLGALARLPPRMRAAVVLRHLLDLSVEETADALGCRPGTVKSQTARDSSSTSHRLTLAHVTITPRHRSAARSSTRSGRVVQLVDYTGTQLPGFTVGQVPQGWHLSTSTPTALLITKDGSTNNDPDVFLGKLACSSSPSMRMGSARAAR